MLPVHCRAFLQGKLGPAEGVRFLAQAASQLASWAEGRNRLHSGWLGFPLSRAELRSVRRAMQESQKELTASRRALAGFRQALKSPHKVEQVLLLWERAERHHRNYCRERLQVDPMIENRRARTSAGADYPPENSEECEEFVSSEAAAPASRPCVAD